MKAISEVLPAGSELVRIGADDWDDDGPFDISFAAVVLNYRKTLMIKGLDKPILPSHWRAVKQWIITNHPTVEEIAFVRKEKGKPDIYRTIPVRKGKTDAFS